MITGVLTTQLAASVPLCLRGPEGQEREIGAVIDTGFDGWLTLPASFIADLGLEWRRRGRALLADGSEAVFDMYEVIVDWDGEPRRVPVDSADIDPLVGMSLLHGRRLTVEVVSGGNVSIERL